MIPPQARDQTAHETGKRRDALRFIAALAKVTWRLRRSERVREDEEP